MILTMSEVTPPYGAARARLTRQGQITVPKAVREALGAQPGDELEFEHVKDGFVVRHRPRTSILAFAGAASDTTPTQALAKGALTALVEEEVARAHRSTGSDDAQAPRRRPRRPRQGSG